MSVNGRHSGRHSVDPRVTLVSLASAILVFGCGEGGAGTRDEAPGATLGTDLQVLDRTVDRRTVAVDVERHPTDSLAIIRELSASDEVGRIVDLEVVDDRLVAADVVLPPMIKFFDVRTGDMVNALGPEGEGPGEFVSPRAIQQLGVEPPTVGVFDFQNRRLAVIELGGGPKSEAAAPRVTREVTFRSDALVKSPVRIGSGYAASGIFADHTFARFGTSGRHVGWIQADPPAGSHGKATSAREMNMNHLDVAPDGRRLAIAYQNVNRVDLFTSVEGPYLSATGPVELEEGGEVRAYVDVAATRSAVYALFVGRGPDGADCEEVHGDELPRRVHVFAWDGTYRGRLILDRPVYTVSASEDGQRLWGFAPGPLPRIIEWRTPAWASGRAEH